MLVENLKLYNFRNYKSLNIDFSKRINIIYGDNGQGKTNILEAVFLCASARSHRTPRDGDLVFHGEQGYYVKLGLSKGSSPSDVEIIYKQSEKRKIKINEVPLKKVGELIGHLNVVIFSPEDLMVIKEGPSERRRFIDITISQLKPSYFYDLQQYVKIISHRNNLLKDIQYNKSLIDTLDVWNNNLVRTGSRIIKVRNEFVKMLSDKARVNHSKLTNDNEILEIRYSPSVELKGESDITSIENNFNKKLESIVNREISKGTTLLGPQRDDYEIFLNDKNIKMFGSQGQQRTAILSVKLAEIDIMKDNTGENPILLLDDVMSELDAKRQDYLLNSINDIQTFITCTDKDIYTGKIGIESSMYHIRDGQVDQIS